MYSPPELALSSLSPSSHHDANFSMISSNTRHYSRSDSSPVYGSNKNASNTNKFGETCERRPAPLAYKRTTTDLCVPQTVSDTSSCCSSESGAGAAYGYASAPNSNCTYSLDVEFDRSNYDSMSDSSLKDYLACGDDSVMMNRLRKSLEQKQEFMNRLPSSRATAELSSWQQPPGSNTYAKLRPHVVSPVESGDGKSGRENQQTSCARLVNASNANTTTPPPFQIVSIRAQQFEKGPVDSKTELFRSELARLSVKRGAANVATRKRDFENRAQQEKQQVAAYPAKESRVTEYNEGTFFPL